MKIGGNLRKLWQKQFCTVFFETRCMEVSVDVCSDEEELCPVLYVSVTGCQCLDSDTRDSLA